MRASSTFFCVLLLSLTSLLAQTRYFPADSFGKDKFVEDWYTQQLAALEEPSFLPLIQVSTQTEYRFLWLRSFHHPIVVRIEVLPDGTGILTTKTGGGAGGYQPKAIIQNQSSKLTSLQIQQFQNLLKKVSFRSLSTTSSTGEIVCDGSEWVIEAVDSGRYHVITRSSPSRGAAYDIGMLALKLADIHVPANEFY